MKQKPIPRVLEIEETEAANQLLLSGEFCQPYFSEKRNKWMIVRRKDA